MSLYSRTIFCNAGRESVKRKLFAMLLMVCIAIFFIPGCSKDDDGDKSPTGGGGGSSSAGSLAEHAGANTVVTETNADQVTTEINSTAWEVFGRAMSTASYGKAAADVTTNLKGDVAGLKNGKATVNGKMITKMSGMTATGVDYDFTCTFYDFSDDGELYLGGSLSYEGSAKYGSNYQLESYTITVKGGLKFNGQYSGSEDFTTTVKIESAGNYSYEGTTTVTSGGKTFTESFKY